MMGCNKIKQERESNARQETGVLRGLEGIYPLSIYFNVFHFSTDHRAKKWLKTGYFKVITIFKCIA